MGIKDFVAEKRADPTLRAAFAVADVAKLAGNLARRMRLNANMKQGDIAAALDCSQPRVSQIESTKVENLPPLDILARYAVACGDKLYLTTASEHAALTERLEAVTAELAEKSDQVDMLAEELGETIAKCKRLEKALRGRISIRGARLDLQYPTKGGVKKGVEGPVKNWRGVSKRSKKGGNAA
jgi:transcriptional regulator with XRE-family HTH domain